MEAVEKIRRYTEGMTFEKFMADEKTVDAVIRNITVIGEAARQVPEEIQVSHPDIPWMEMRGIRNVIVHEYFGVSRDILWRTVQEDLPRLVLSLKKMSGDE